MAGRSVVSARQINNHPSFETKTGVRGREMGLKPKDLMGIPWRLAFALQDDGWYLRQDIIGKSPIQCLKASVTAAPEAMNISFC